MDAFLNTKPLFKRCPLQKAIPIMCEFLYKFTPFHRGAKTIDRVASLADVFIFINCLDTFQHENYDGETSGFPNDIALLKLSEAVVFDDTKQPACVPSAGANFDTSTHNCWISGWGDTKGSLIEHI